nr:immunoglobulin heavy chain junction region [Macaca mulatta]MOW81577.1 immunoglobulin heavy chain junction region [Macaca mulatta]
CTRDHSGSSYLYYFAYW